MKRQLAPILFLCAASTCAAAPGVSPEVRIGTQRHWMILSNASSLNRMHLGDVVLTDSRQVRREWKTTQSLWARMQSRLIVLPRNAYAAIVRRSQQASCAEMPAEQPGLLGVQVSDGRCHEATCVLVRSDSCEFVARAIDIARGSAASLEPLRDLRASLTCAP